ncbi:MAG: T9SS type A sorting domain-containing protein [Bacteroidota bacterium]|nr:T9SS type A sorting domain-containing protein [Bacteroidota bacterium]
MRKTNYVITLVLIGFVFSISINQIVIAQERIVTLPAETDLVKFINDDATARTAFLPGQTIYELPRNGYYVCRSSLTTLGYHLYIRAEDGTGPKPIIRPGSPDGVGTGGRVFFPGSDITLKNIYLANKDELGNLINNGIRMNVANNRIVIDSCHLDYDIQSLVRLDASNSKVYIKNSIISNLGNNNGLNGRVVDTRSNNQDTIVLYNNIIYNNAEKLLRTAGAVVKYIKIDHNTMVNNTEGDIDFGPVVKGYLTNNLFYNCGYAGNDSASSGSLILVSSTAQYLEVRNNNYYVHPDVVNAYPKSVTSCFPLAPYSKWRFLDTSVVRIATATGNFTGNDSIAIVLTKSPKFTVECMLDFNSICVLAPNKKDSDMGEGIKIDFEPHYVFDFRYPTSSLLYTKADGGLPIGSLLEWKITVGVIDDKGKNILPENYLVLQNYPNPFNPVTTINYQMSVKSNVRLIVIDALGREVATLVNSAKEPGNYSVQFDASQLNSGVYFAKLQTNIGMKLTKMMLIK